MPDADRTIVTVKVQLPYYATAENSAALIYDRGREHVQQRKLDEAEYRLIGKQAKAFCGAWWSEATGWVLLNRARAERW